MELELISLHANRRINSNMIAHLIAAATKQPPAVPFGILNNRTIITYPVGVKLILRAAETAKLTFNKGHTIETTKLLKVDKYLWLNICNNLTEYNHILLSYWIMWGLNWIIIDNEDIQHLLTPYVKTQLIRLMMEHDLRSETYLEENKRSTTLETTAHKGKQ